MIPLIIILLNLGGRTELTVVDRRMPVRQQEALAPSNTPKISPAEMWVRLIEEGQPWSEPPILKGNSAADRLNHNPE